MLYSGVFKKKSHLFLILKFQKDFVILSALFNVILFLQAWSTEK